MKNKLFAVVFLCVGLASCAVAPATRQIVNSFPIDKPFDQVWTAVIETLSELNLSIMNMEKVSGLITTDFISFQGQTNKDYCDCGTLGTSAEWEETDRQGKFNVFVKRISDNSCEIKINSVFKVTMRNVSSKQVDSSPCVSTGNLEANIYKLIKDKIK